MRPDFAPLPVRDGLCLAHGNRLRTFTGRNRDHPPTLAALDAQTGTGVDREAIRRTLLKVFEAWRWLGAWGLEFPRVAMAADRLSEPDLAIRALFIEWPKNTWLANGRNPLRAGLPLYLPGNGGLPATAGEEGRGIEGASPNAAPGFPPSG